MPLVRVGELLVMLISMGLGRVKFSRRGNVEFYDLNDGLIL